MRAQESDLISLLLVARDEAEVGRDSQRLTARDFVNWKREGQGMDVGSRLGVFCTCLGSVMSRTPEIKP
jgi:hypothetical protein